MTNWWPEGFVDAAAVAKRAEIRVREQLIDDGDQFWIQSHGFTMILTPPDCDIGKCFFFGDEVELGSCQVLAARINGGYRSQLGFLLSEVAAAYLRGDLHIDTAAIIEYEDGMPRASTERLLTLQLRLAGEAVARWLELTR